MEKENIKNVIEDFYNNMSYYSEYNFDIWITIIIIVIVLLISIYFFILNSITNQKNNWEENKCSPFFMPFASLLSKNGEVNASANLQACLNTSNYNLASTATTPINNIFNVLSTFFESLYYSIEEFVYFLGTIIEKLFQVYAMIIERFTFILDEVSKTYISIVDFFGSLMGVITSIYYKLIIIIDSIKYSFSVLALGFLTIVVTPSLITSLILGVLSAVTRVAAAVITAVFPPAASGAWIVHGVAFALFLPALAFTIFTGLLYAILGNFSASLIKQTSSLHGQSNQDSVDVLQQPEIETGDDCNN